MFYVTRNGESKVKKEKSPKIEETEKKIKREEEWWSLGEVAKEWTRESIFKDDKLYENKLANILF